jgi:hypothetical protein
LGKVQTQGLLVAAADGLAGVVGDDVGEERCGRGSNDDEDGAPVCDALGEVAKMAASTRMLP